MKKNNLKKLSMRSLSLLMALVCVLVATHFRQNLSVADTTKIVYSSNGGLWKMNADGSGVTQLTFPSTGDFDYSPAWSPDGSQIAFVRFKSFATPYIHVMNADGSGLTYLGITGTDPTWSPDGKKLAFVNGYDITFNGRYYAGCSTIGNSSIRTYTFATGKQLNVTGSFNGTDPSWSPDGAKIAFVKNRDYIDYGVYATTLATNFTSRLTYDEAPPADPEWSSDGAKIVYARGYQTSTGCPYDGNMQTGGGGPNGLRGGEIVVFDVAFGTYQTLLGQYGFSPEWSPDDSKVLYSNGGIIIPELWTMNNDGTGNAQIPNGQSSEFAGSWSY